MQPWLRGEAPPFWEIRVAQAAAGGDTFRTGRSPTGEQRHLQSKNPFGSRCADTPSVRGRMMPLWRPASAQPSFWDEVMSPPPSRPQLWPNAMQAASSLYRATAGTRWRSGSKADRPLQEADVVPWFTADFHHTGCRSRRLPEGRSREGGPFRTGVKLTKPICAKLGFCVNEKSGT